MASNCPTCCRAVFGPDARKAVRKELEGQIDWFDSLRDSLDDGEITAAQVVVIAAAKKLRATLAEFDTIAN